MSISRAAFLVSTVFASGVLLAQGQSPAPAAEGTALPRQGITIGVVDFAKVMEVYPRAIQERKKLDEFWKQCLAQVDQERRRADEIRLKRDDLQADTMDRDLKDLEYAAKQREIEALKSVLAQERSRRVERLLVTMYEDVQRAVALVAKDRGVQLVLRKHDDVVDGSTTNKARVYEVRQVWYAADELDLTPAVIQRLQVPLPDEPKDATNEKDQTPGKDQAPAKTQPKESTGGKPGN
jgi:Skp family chaperone for outer membrane proteins